MAGGCCQIADTMDHMDELPGAVEWLERLLSRVPNDPGVLMRLGSLHARYSLPSAGPFQCGHPPGIKACLKDRSWFPDFCSCQGMTVLELPAAWNSAVTTTMADGTACIRNGYCLMCVRLQDTNCQIANNSRMPVPEHA